MPRNWVVFDAMGVIFTVGDDTNELLVPFVRAKNPKIPEATIQALYTRASQGKITSQEFWTKVGLIGNYPDVQKEYLRTLTLDPDFIEVARSLKGEYHLGMLSNDVAEWSEMLRHVHDLEDLLEVFVISSEVGNRKPCPEIFSAFLARASARPEDCAFIDDRDENLDAAARLGFRTIRFNRTNTTGPCRCSKCIASFKELPLSLADVFLED